MQGASFLFFIFLFFKKLAKANKLGNVLGFGMVRKMNRICVGNGQLL